VSDDRARRVGLNEAIFRQVNEQIRDLNRTFETEEGTMTVICECGNSDCTERLQLRVQEYERVRSDARLYVIARGTRSRLSRPWSSRTRATTSSRSTRATRPSCRGS
jgi:hypothetical protein